MNTERDYLRDLRLAVEYFMKPGFSFLSSREIDKLFSNIDTLIEVNEAILSEMEKTVPGGDDGDGNRLITVMSSPFIIHVRGSEYEYDDFSRKS